MRYLKVLYFKLCRNIKSTNIYKVQFLIIFLFIFLDFSFGQNTIYVENSNDSGTGSLRQAIEDSNSNDTIRFQSGITDVFLSSSELVIDKSLNIIADTNITISRTSGIFRIIRLTDNYHITLLMKNLTIANGHANGESSGKHGGGILASTNFSKLILYNCTIQNNKAGNGGESGTGGSGGGIYGKNVHLFNCSIINNRCGHGGDGAIGPPSPGGDGGKGGGLYCDSTIIVNCLFLENESGKGGESPFTIGGWAGDGGGLFIGYGDIINSTFCFNIAQQEGYEGKPGEGGGIFTWSSGTVHLHNCIFSDNIAYYQGNDLLGSFYADYTLVSDITDCELIGENNLVEVSPEFVNPPYDLTLSYNSPAINAGNPDTSGLQIPNHDLSNNPRIVGDIIDMGAYEYQFSVGAKETVEPIFIKIFPNPSSGKFHIETSNINVETLTIKIYNYSSALVRQIKSNLDQIYIDLSDQPKGIYLISIETESKIISKKINLI